MSRISKCRSCGASNLLEIFNMGEMPHSDGLLTSEQLKLPEPKYPLELIYCSDCHLVQISETIPSEDLFCKDYPYYSSFTTELLRHSKENVTELIDWRNLNSDSLVVELASNDGYLLQYYKERNIPVLGIDPADGPHKEAEKKGIPTLNTFFTLELAQNLKNEGKQADVIHANNVLAHVPDTNGFLQGINRLLKDTGITSIEVPYVKNLITYNQFDTIYHEHLCYFSVLALNKLFRNNGLFLNDIRHYPIHGGSLRLYAGKKDKPSPAVKEYIDNEIEAGLDSMPFYRDFASSVLSVKSSLVKLITDLRRGGKTIHAYGAAAKGAILLNFFGISTDLVPFVYDKNTFKQGRHMPGTHQPILAPDAIMENRPDYLLILPWNFKDEIILQQRQFHEQEGKFIIPIPKPIII